MATTSPGRDLPAGEISLSGIAMKTWIGALAGAGLLAFHANAWAATYGLDEISTERLKDASKIAPMQIDGAFGDKLSLYNGTVSFENVDISLPGNGPAVEFRRTYTVTDNDNRGDVAGLGNWSVEVPSISGVFIDNYGWTVKGSNPQARCSSGTSPVDTTLFFSSEYWDGNTLNVPGQINEKVLRNTSHNRPQPTNGVTYPWTTKSGWLLSCKTVLVNNQPNEVFVATSPDGVRYHLDRSVIRDAPYLAYQNVVYSWDGSAWRQGYSRHRNHYVATLVEDRHGNTVTYSYDTSGRPTRIEGSDGRLITIDYNGTDKVQSVSAVGRTYNYRYTGNSLTEVSQPDGSTWTYSSGSPSLISHFFDFQADFNRCRVPDYNGYGFTYSVKNPSNAQANFEFDVVRHHRQNVPEYCVFADSGSGAKPSHWKVPLYSDAYSLLKKVTSGPGVVAGTWTYSYPAFAHPGGFRALCESQTPSPCPRTKKVIVQGPTAYEEYEFGIWWEVNDGQLISHSVGPAASSVLSKSTNTYVSELEAAALPFGVHAGGSNGAYYDQLNDRQRPVRERRIDQQGVAFKRVTNSWDAFARPLSVTRSSTIPDVDSRTDVTTYSDNLNLWATGLVTSVINTDLNKYLKRTTYNAKALPEKVYGIHGVASPVPAAEQTFTYNADGTVNTVADGRSNVTRYSQWKRGVPQLIELPPTADNAAGADIQSVVADNGTITSVIGEANDKTCYSYDSMLRTASVTQTSEGTPVACDSTTWAGTTQGFAQSTAKAYELPIGHWQQTVSTGNARTILYFDAFWRPVVEETFDAATPATTRTLVVKRYDAEGRLVFQSYPMASLTDYRLTTLKGTHTTHDALGRVLTVTQDSELGPLVTSTSYLSGFLTQVITPNGKKTVTGFFAQGEPSTQMPAWMDQPEGVFTRIGRDVLGNPTEVTRSGPGG